MTPMSITGMLKRRNLKLFSYDQTEHLIFPKSFSKGDREKLYQLLSSYGFRTLLKDLIIHKEHFSLGDLTRYCSEKTAKLYLKKLLGLKLVKKRKEGGYRLVRDKGIFSLGETLEWFIAQLLKKELECDALWSVVLADLPAGGDFDILADCEGSLLYLEVKSAPPRSIEIDNIRSYLNRVADLRPDLTIFLEDTTLRMRDKILPIFEDELKVRLPGKGGKKLKFEKIQEETYRHDNFFITNAKPGILENIRLCLSNFLLDRGIQLSKETH